ncbi:MAG: tRNA dihydrouridine synthase DusB [Clostridia bacterium]|nr:tRNA dihydrouridine synthase DusB [Clostridia bacterium]
MMKIADISLKNNIFLAPMAGVTDLAFRIICDEFGAGLSYTEMVSAKALSFSDKKTGKLMQTDNLPTAVQIFGSDPVVFTEIVPVAEKEGLFIDINMGCPAPKITGNGEGSALMKNLEKAEAVIDAACRSSAKPVTVKMRAGWNEEHINAPELARIAQSCGAAAVTVHGRTREQFYGGKADRSIIRRVCESVSIPVIANGDIFSPQDAADMLRETGAAAVMIGRGAQGCPWIFTQTEELFSSGRVKTQLSPREKIDIALRHIKLMCELKGEYIGIREARKHAAWYIKGMKGAAALRNKINCAVTLDEMSSLLLSVCM